MSFSNRIFVYGPVGLLALLAVFYALFWKVSADMLAARLERANGGEIMPDVFFAFADKTVSGFPFRLDVVLGGVTVAHEGPAGETTWRSEKVAVHALSYGQGQFVLEAAGLQSLAQPSEDGGPPHVLTFTPGIARASAILRGGELTRFDFDMWQVQGKDASPGAPPDRNFSAGRAQLHLLGNADKTMSVALKIENATLGSGYHAQLGPELELVTLMGKIAQAQVFDGVRKGTQSPVGALEAWRAARGKIEVDSFLLHWSGVKVEAKGELLPAVRNYVSGKFRGELTGLRAFAKIVTRDQKPVVQARAMKLVDLLPVVKEPIGAAVSFDNGQLNVNVELLPGLVGAF